MRVRSATETVSTKDWLSKTETRHLKLTRSATCQETNCRATETLSHLGAHWRNTAPASTRSRGKRRKEKPRELTNVRKPRNKSNQLHLYARLHFAEIVSEVDDAEVGAVLEDRHRAYNRQEERTKRMRDKTGFRCRRVVTSEYPLQIQDGADTGNSQYTSKCEGSTQNKEQLKRTGMIFDSGESAENLQIERVRLTTRRAWREHQQAAGINDSAKTCAEGSGKATSASSSIKHQAQN